MLVNTDCTLVAARPPESRAASLFLFHHKWNKKRTLIRSPTCRIPIDTTLCGAATFKANIWSHQIFTQKVVDGPSNPMISHLYPWTRTIVLGGTRWCYRACPLSDVCGGALGEASGIVYFHL